jgi:hypothetical protein
MDAKEFPGGTPEKPIWMAMSTIQKPKLKDILVVTAISVLPVAIAILMQRPALRQAIQMKIFHSSRIACQYTADFFQVMATKAAQEYQKAQM